MQCALREVSNSVDIRISEHKFPGVIAPAASGSLSNCSNFGLIARKTFQCNSPVLSDNARQTVALTSIHPDNGASPIGVQVLASVCLVLSYPNADSAVDQRMY